MERPSLYKKAEPRKTLRIAQIAPLVERVPPKRYGGTERVVHTLTEGLVKKGHEVTLFASGDSITSARLVSVYPRSIREARLPDIYGSNMLALLNIGTAYDSQRNFDIIHDHTGFLGLPTANISRKPVVTTHHGPVTAQEKRMLETLRKPYIVTISKSQGQFLQNLNHLGTVYNGLDMSSYPFSASHDGYLLFVGRISMEKGTHFAIEVAQYLDLPLIIAAKLEPIDRPYFDEYISPRLSDERITWIGEVDESTRNNLMARALCLLHPVTWREPFGLTMIESMACGSPVIGFRRGSIPEIISHGKTGFVADTLEEIMDYVPKLKNISREYCRQYALKTFSAERMVSAYEQIYYRLLGI